MIEKVRLSVGLFSLPFVLHASEIVHPSEIFVFFLIKTFLYSVCFKVLPKMNQLPIRDPLMMKAMHRIIQIHLYIQYQSLLMDPMIKPMMRLNHRLQQLLFRQANQQQKLKPQIIEIQSKSQLQLRSPMMMMLN